MFHRAISVLFAVLMASALRAQDLPPPDSVTIQGLSYGGNGCPAGTMFSNLSPDAQAITFLFADFDVDSSATGGVRVKKSCGINLQLQVPAGWTYTLFSVDYRGFTQIDDLSFARLRSWYTLEGQSIRISNLKLRGPAATDFQQRAWVPLDALPWLQCNRSTTHVAISTELMAEGPAALLTVDSIDGELRQDYGIAWRRCSNSTTWTAACQVVLETQWGTNIQLFDTTATGGSHQEARGRAEQAALSQCERRRSTMRPLVQAMSRCATNQPSCTARPL